MAVRKLQRDAKGKMFITDKGIFYEIIGDIDCEYRRTQLLSVVSKKWKGSKPKAPFQFLGIIDGKDFTNIIRADGKVFGNETQ